MSMQPIVMKVALFRGDFDQARSQYSLLWLMEALVRINQSHIRQFRGLAKQKKVPAPYPQIYQSGIHYEPEAGTEDWLDIPNILNVPGGTFPGPWGDCEDLACWRTAELREDLHKPIKAKPFAKWRRKPDGAYGYHALTLLPDGRLEDASLILGMGNEPEFARLRMTERYKEGSVTPTIQYAKIPDVMVVDPEKDSGYGKLQGKIPVDPEMSPPGAPVTGIITGRMPGAGAKPAPAGFNATSNEDGSIHGWSNSGSDVAAWGFDQASVDINDMRALVQYQKKIQKQQRSQLAGAPPFRLIG